MSGSEPIRIVAGSPADLDDVMAVMRDGFDPAFGEAWTSAQCAGILPMAGVWLILAKTETQLAGFALGRIILAEAELLLIAVRRDCQGLGIGKSLLDQFIKDAEQRGAAHLHLEVRDGNPALKLYTDAGFHQVGARRNYYCGSGGALFHALTLSKSLKN